MKKAQLVVTVILISIINSCSFANAPQDVAAVTSQSEKEIKNYMFLKDPIDQKNMQENFVQIRTCVLKRDISCVASYMMLSDDGTKVNYVSHSHSITSIEYLTRNYDKIFTANVIQAMQAQGDKDLSYASDGAMIGNGQMWLDYFCGLDETNKCYFKIDVINADAKFFDK